MKYFDTLRKALKAFPGSHPVQVPVFEDGRVRVKWAVKI